MQSATQEAFKEGKIAFVIRICPNPAAHCFWTPIRTLLVANSFLKAVSLFRKAYMHSPYLGLRFSSSILKLHAHHGLFDVCAIEPPLKASPHFHHGAQIL